MAARLLSLSSAGSVLAAAAKKTVATAKGENEDLILTVTLYIDPADVKEMIGSDLDGHYIVAEVKVEPEVRQGDHHRPRRLRAAHRQQRRKGHAVRRQPDRRAGSAGHRADRGEAEETRMDDGRAGDDRQRRAASEDDDKDKPEPKMVNDDQENPLKKVLDAKILPEKKTDQPTEGLLYFPMEKQKMKDLELRLRRPGEPHHPAVQAARRLKTNENPGRRGRKAHRRLPVPRPGRRRLRRGRRAHRRRRARTHPLHRLRPGDSRPDAARHGRPAGAGEDPQPQGRARRC